MKKSLSDAYEKYYAEGKVVIGAKTPPKYTSIVEGVLRGKTIITLVPKCDLEWFYTCLLDEGIPPEDAKAIARSTYVLEDGAYLVPKEDYSFDQR